MNSDLPFFLTFPPLESKLSGESVSLILAQREQITGEELRWEYTEINRIGDHLWWISDLRKFQSHYPRWQLTRDVPSILKDIYEANSERWVCQERNSRSQ